MPIKKINFQERSLALFQDNVDAAITPLQNSPFVGGVLLTGIALTTGSNAVPHTLGRTPIMWVITDRNGVATIYRTAWNTLTISLTVSANLTVSLWVN